jgi:glycosyltransferase involved in cell wall biosynthesis
VPPAPSPTPTERATLGDRDDVLVACPDARPPAFEAVVGLAAAGRLKRFCTATYHDADGPMARVGRRLAPALERRLRRRHHAAIPSRRVASMPWVDLAGSVENRLGDTKARRALARWRTRRFDRAVARAVERLRPSALLTFSDVGTEFALPACRRLGIPTVLSVVCGDPREERVVLEREAERSPEFFRLYLGDGRLDRAALAWLHDRRLCELERADRVVVPSDHLAETLASHGTPRERIAVIPYAADTNRFRPDPAKRPDPRRCTFLFAGGITQRKGIKYLLEAWRLVRRPGWALRLLGPIPREPGPLATALDEVEWLGRVGHADVPARMASSDVFVFPSLFEGSAVVTYEALASGLPCVVTPEAGSVVRDEEEGYLVPPADPEALAERMERLGRDAALRAEMSARARARAEAFDWPRYQRALNAEIVRAADGPAAASTPNG